MEKSEKMETITVTVHPTSEDITNFEKNEKKQQILFGGGSSYNNSSSHASRIVTTVLHIVLRLIALFIVCVCCFAAFGRTSTSLRSWHPSLSAIGLFLMMHEAIFVFSGNSFLSRNLKYSERMAVHGVLQLAACTFFVIGLISVYNYKLNDNQTHFDTWHGISGLIAMILMILLSLGGFMLRYSYLISHIISPVSTKIIHSAAGVTTYLITVFSVCFGFDSEWFRRGFDDSLITSLIVFSVISASLVVIQPIVKIVNRVRDRI